MPKNWILGHKSQHYPDLTLALDDSNIVKALTLNIASSGYHM